MSVSDKGSHIILGIPKIPQRYASIVMSLLLSIFMTCIVSMISTYRGIGADPDFIRIWLGAWAISWVVAFPTLLLVMPIVRKSTAALVRAS
jgi:Na+/glutamate symporter